MSFCVISNVTNLDVKLSLCAFTRHYKSSTVACAAAENDYSNNKLAHQFVVLSQKKGCKLSEEQNQ